MTTIISVILKAMGHWEYAMEGGKALEMLLGQVNYGGLKIFLSHSKNQPDNLEEMV